MNVSQLIKALQEVPNHDAEVTLDGADIDVVDITGATRATAPADAPGAGGDPDPGVVDIQAVSGG